MATSLGEADAMITACQRNGVRLAIGHMRRFYRGWEEARRLVAGGAIGTPQKVWIMIRLLTSTSDRQATLERGFGDR